MASIRASPAGEPARRSGPRSGAPGCAGRIPPVVERDRPPSVIAASLPIRSPRVVPAESANRNSRQASAGSMGSSTQRSWAGSRTTGIPVRFESPAPPVQTPSTNAATRSSPDAIEMWVTTATRDLRCRHQPPDHRRTRRRGPLKKGPKTSADRPRRCRVWSRCSPRKVSGGVTRALGGMAAWRHLPHSPERYRIQMTRRPKVSRGGVSGPFRHGFRSLDEFPRADLVLAGLAAEQRPLPALAMARPVEPRSDRDGHRGVVLLHPAAHLRGEDVDQCCRRLQARGRVGVLRRAQPGCSRIRPPAPAGRRANFRR